MNGTTHQQPRDYEHLVDDPAVAEEQALALCGLLAGIQADAVLIWDDVPSVVLGHIVARYLGLRLIRICEVEGIVDFVSDVPEHSRALLLAPELREEKTLLAMRTLVGRQGAIVAAVAVLDNSAVASAARVDGLQVVALRSS